jgi:hypothetical protein
LLVEEASAAAADESTASVVVNRSHFRAAPLDIDAFSALEFPDQETS